MFCENNASRLIRDLMVRVVRLFDAGALVAEIDRIPLEVIPRLAAPYRCCIHHDRAVIRHRLLAILGIRVEAERDAIEQQPLSVYAGRALARGEPPSEVLTVIDEACTGCVRTEYLVTDACRRCVARPCSVNCPRQAIEFFRDRAHIDHQKCVNCGICQKVCPYHAIVRVPVPCEEACPVGAIKKDAEGTQDIDFDLCIYCGKCLHACPFGAIMDVSHLVDILRLLAAGQEVVAMLAPAVVGQFPGDLSRLAAAVAGLGFAEVVEVALGADVAVGLEAAEYRERRGRGDPFMTTSCCPSYNRAVERHLPAISRYRSHANTPMHYTARLVRERRPAATVVFIGPCVAKRWEIRHDPIVDHYLSFDEVAACLQARGLEVAAASPAPVMFPATAAGRGFPVTGGVVGAIAAAVAGPDPVVPVLVDGLDRANLARLQQFAGGQCPGTLVEVMACEGGCVGGPNVLVNPKVTSRRVQMFAAASGKAPAGTGGQGAGSPDRAP